MRMVSPQGLVGPAPEHSHPLPNPQRLVPLSLGHRIALFWGSPKVLSVQELSYLISPC